MRRAAVWVLAGAGTIAFAGCGDADDSVFGGGDANGGSPEAGLSAGGRAAGRCTNSLDCSGSTPICDRDFGDCVECVASADCDGGLACVNRHCRGPCTSDRDCTPMGQLCDQAAGRCADCLTSTDCARGESCEGGVCERASGSGGVGGATSENGGSGTGAAAPDAGGAGTAGGAPNEAGGASNGDGGAPDSSGGAPSNGGTGSGGMADGGTGSGGKATGGTGSGGKGTGGSGGKCVVASCPTCGLPGISTSCCTPADVCGCRPLLGTCTASTGGAGGSAGSGGAPGKGGSSAGGAPVCGNADGDGADDCEEAADGDAWTDPAVFNGVRARLVDQCGTNGACSEVDTLSEVNACSAGAALEITNQYAGWDFNNTSDSSCTAAYGFEPPFTACSSDWAADWQGCVHIAASGRHCFQIAGTASEGCAALYVNGNTGTADAVTAGAVKCFDFAPGNYPIRWMYTMDNGSSSSLHLRYCSGGSADCTPSAALPASMLRISCP